MKITLLGTGTSQGVPVIGCNCKVCSSIDLKDKRLRSSVMIEVDNQVFVVDTGPDFRQQMLRENVQNIDAILFTHHHKDHVAGMDDIRAFNHKWKKDIQVYCNTITENALHKEFPYIFSNDNYPGVPKVNLNILNVIQEFYEMFRLDEHYLFYSHLPTLLKFYQVQRCLKPHQKRSFRQT